MMLSSIFGSYDHTHHSKQRANRPPSNSSSSKLQRNSTILRSSSRLAEKEDDQIYGPPSPRRTPLILASPIIQLGHHTILSTTTARNSSITTLDSPSSTDELFLSEYYPPIQTRLYPFFNEKLSSPIGMGRGQPIITSTTSNPPPSYFGLPQTWNRIARTLSSPPYHLSELPDTLSYPADQVSLSQLESALSAYNFILPNAVRDHFLIHDGQDIFSHTSSNPSGSHQPGIVWGLWLMSCEEAQAEWGFWRRLDGGHMPADAFAATDFASSSNQPHPSSSFSSPLDQTMSSCPQGWVRETYSHPGWLPLLSDRVGNYIGVDLCPPPFVAETPPSHQTQPAIRGGGQGHAAPQAGQVIAFGREIDEKVVLWRGDGPDGWANWLASFADDLEDGRFASLTGRKRSGTASRTRRLNSDPEVGWTNGNRDMSGEREEDPDDDEDCWEEDGLGEVGYFNDGSGYGSGFHDDDFHGWRLSSQYRGMSIIEALCARSKKRWAEIGLYSSRSEPSQSIHSYGSLPTRSSKQLVHAGVEPSPGPSSSESRLANPAAEIPPSPAPIAFVTPPSPRPSGQVDFSPNRPVSGSSAPSKRLGSRSSPAHQPDGALRSPTLEPDHSTHCQPKKQVGKRQAPAPMCLDLPTMDSLTLESESNTEEETEDSDFKEVETHANHKKPPDSRMSTSNRIVSRLSMVRKRVSEEMGRRTSGLMKEASSNEHRTRHSQEGVASTPNCKNEEEIGMGIILSSKTPIKSTHLIIETESRHPVSETIIEGAEGYRKNELSSILDSVGSRHNDLNETNEQQRSALGVEG